MSSNLIQTIQERLAKICEGYTHYPPVTGETHLHLSLAAVIRAADLSDLEPKGMEGELVNYSALSKHLLDTQGFLNGRGMKASAKVCAAAGAEIATLTARLKAKEAECEAMKKVFMEVGNLKHKGTVFGGNIEGICDARHVCLRCLARAVLPRDEPPAKEGL